MKQQIRPKNYFFILAGLLILLGCEQNNPPSISADETTVELKQPQSVIDEVPQIAHIQTDSQFTIGNKRYLYDISEHSIEELQSLLKRAEEITQTGSENLEDLEIVMILHGPDIGWFTLDSYDDNKELVDLAKKLDTFDIIDLKVCEKSIDSLKIDRQQIPNFIESVPFAPDEIRRLSDAGYTHL